MQLAIQKMYCQAPAYRKQTSHHVSFVAYLDPGYWNQMSALFRASTVSHSDGFLNIFKED